MAAHTDPHRESQPIVASSGLPPYVQILSDLEASLRSSQLALLAGDLARLEQLTAEQSSLARRLADLWREATASLLSGELETARRVLRAGLVQQALLRRAERSLRLIFHLMAGSSATYVPVSASSATVQLDLVPAKEA